MKTHYIKPQNQNTSRSQTQGEEHMKYEDIKDFNQRCEEHPDHQTGMVSERMIQQRLSEEIDELREYIEKRTWVGLTDEDIEWCYEKQKQTFYRYKYSVHGQQITKFDDPYYHFILAVTAKLKQKNGFAEEKNT